MEKEAQEALGVREYVRFAEFSEPAEDRAVVLSNSEMTPEQKARLQPHLDAIAEILYEDSDLASMQTLEAIELTVREPIQAHVSPELGRFLSAPLAARKQDESASSKAP